MIHAAFGVPPTQFDSQVQDFLIPARIEAAKAFRVLRDTRSLDAAGQLDFIARVPGRNLLVHLAHPGLWSVTLEPRVNMLDIEDSAPGGEIFRRRPDVASLARFSAPHLDAWARTGEDFPFAHRSVGRTAFRGLKTYDTDDEAGVAATAASENYAGVLQKFGGAVLWSRGDIPALAELILLVEQAAKVELLARPFSRSPAWA